MKTNDKNDCLECMEFFIISEGFNSEYCSKECRDAYFKKQELKENEFKKK